MSTGQSIFLMALMVFILAVYSFKWALHFQYLRVKNQKKPGHWTDYYKRNYIHKKDKLWWRESIMLFPLLYPVELTGNETEDFWLQKIKRTNLSIYFILIVLLLAGIYFSKLPKLQA
tara:strand:+ start:42 stop:392 length:351 start_codon:yes stop_codon:yes gene_type:complete